MPKAIAFVSNGISALMLQAALVEDGIKVDNLCLISGRRLTQDWVVYCDAYIEFSKKPSLSLIGQFGALSFYVKAVRSLKKWLSDPNVSHVYIANSDNLISNHLINWCAKHHNVKLSVVVEGNMNYHSVTMENRAWWRWWLKPAVASIFGLRFRKPIGHLSGSYEPRVDRIVAYTGNCLEAPADRTQVLPFPKAAIIKSPDPNGVLILLTGIAQWMSDEDFKKFRRTFGKWVKSLNASKIWVKPHPNYPSGGIEEEIGEFEWFTDPRGIETLAGEIPAQTVVGYWSTGLVTLKFIRPDIRCIDFGHDFYSSAAYHGDENVGRILTATGVEMVDLAPWLNNES